MRKAVVLLSGGLDSSTTLAIAQEGGFEVDALTFSYGQRHERELRSAAAVAKALKVQRHEVITLELGAIGGSALTDPTISLPTGRSLEEIGKGVPATYVPARNTVLLSHALAWAEAGEADAIFVGANAIDYSGYVDCRPEFYEAFQEVARLGTRRGVEGNPVEILYPLIAMTKGEIIRRALDLKVPLELTWSCYSGGEVACGGCDACLLRLKGFKEVGETDPLSYESYPDWYP